MGNSAGLRGQKAGESLRRLEEFAYPLDEWLESWFLLWLWGDTCHLVIVGGLGVRAAALLQALPPLSVGSIQLTKITWKPLQRHTEQESAFLMSQSAAVLSLSPTYQVEMR